MRMTLAIPVMNQLNDTKGIIELLRVNTSDETEWLIVDNGSSDNWEGFIRKYIKPKRLNFIRNDENVGLIKTMQQFYENCETDVLAIIHNDVFVYEKDWDRRVLSYFEEIKGLGGVGFFGSQGCGPKGERIQDVPSPGIMAGMSNMLEAEIHGMRMNKEWSPVAIFDGFFQCFHMEMLKKGGGFDQRYYYHHIYDRDASLESLRRGYKNIVVDIPCHHVCGATANRSEYQNWIKNRLEKDNLEVKIGKDRQGDIHHPTMQSADLWTHDENSRLFAEKFKDVLPLYVENDFSFRSGLQGQWDFKGNKIVGYGYENKQRKSNKATKNQT